MASRRSRRSTPRQDYREARLFGWFVFSFWFLLCCGLIVLLPPVGLVLLGLGVLRLITYIKAAKATYRGRQQLFDTFAGKAPRQ